jgi:hypothetical protein
MRASSELPVIRLNFAIADQRVGASAQNEAGLIAVMENRDVIGFAMKLYLTEPAVSMIAQSAT